MSNVLELALEALNSLFPSMLDGENVCKLRTEAIAALKEAIKQQGEPVAWLTYDNCGRPMLWIDYQEAALYCDEDDTPQPIYTSAPTIPEGYVLVPDDLLVRVSASLGAFTSDEGWRQVDMDNMDNLDAILSAAPKGEQP